MARENLGKRVYPFTGASIRDKNGKIVTPSIFGYKSGQIKVTALGRAKDTIRLTDVDTGEKHVISRYDYEAYKEELKAGHFKHKEAFFKATYWKTGEGQKAKAATATQNFERMLNERYEKVPDFTNKKEYIMELFRNLTFAEKREFFEEEDKLIRDLWEYKQALDVNDYPELANSSELDFLTKKLESYFIHDTDRLRRIYHKSTLKRMGLDLYQMIRNG